MREMHDVALNRYCFLPRQGRPLIRPVLQEILVEIQSQIASTAWHIRVWPKAISGSYVTLARERLNKHKYLQGGWRLKELDQCVVVFKAGSASALFEEKVKFQSHKEGREIVLFGDQVDSACFSCAQAAPSLRLFSKLGEFVFGIRFMEWMVDNTLSVACVQYDDLGRENLLLVTHTEMDLELLKRKVSSCPILMEPQAS